MSTVYAAQGSAVSATSGAARRVAISAVSNTTPIQVTAAGHAFLQTDSVWIEGTGIGAIDNQMFQVNIVGPNVFSLLGTSASGTSSTGYAIDYELQPAIVIPTGGELVDPNVMGAALEGLANPAPFLYQRTGKLRVHNEYRLLAGSITEPYYSSPWSVNNNFTSTSEVALANATFTFQLMSDDTGIPPQFITGDIIFVSMSFSALTLIHGSGHVICQLGVALSQGGVLGSVLGAPSAIIDNQITNVSQASAIGVSGQLGNFTSPATNLAISIFARIDFINTGGAAFDLDLIGPCTGTVIQYRKN